MTQSINYNEFKFNAILNLRVPSYRDLEYDRQFDVLPALYELFRVSSYNDDNICEWECMEEFLNDPLNIEAIDNF